MQIKKVCLGEDFSVFLTNRGQVLACGHPAFTGLDHDMAKLNKPVQVCCSSYEKPRLTKLTAMTKEEPPFPFFSRM